MSVIGDIYGANYGHPWLAWVDSPGALCRRRSWDLLDHWPCSVRVFQSVAQQLPQVYQYLDLELPVGERMGKRECIGDVSECGNNVMIRNGG